MKKYTVGGWIIRNEVYALSIKAPFTSESYAHFKLQFDEETPNVGIFNTRYSFEYEQTESGESEIRGIFTTNSRKLICTHYETGENSIELTEPDFSSILLMVNIPAEVLDILFKIGNQKEDTIDEAFRGNGESHDNDPQDLVNEPRDGSVRGGKRLYRKNRKTRRRQARK